MNDTIPLQDTPLVNLAGQFGITDPNTLRLLELINQQNNEVDEEESPKEPISDNGLDSEVMKELLRENRELYMENEILMDQIETLASALGACPLCWGDDTHCDECQGRGTPGAYLPDQEAFHVFVLPTIHRMRKQRHTRMGKSRMPQDNEKLANNNPDELRRGKENT